MSMLRLLSPARGFSASRVKDIQDDITLSLRVPSYGAIYMTPPSDPLWAIVGTTRPTEDELLHGELDIRVPPGSGRKRCKAIRVGLRTVARLNMGPGRGWEEDVIFERKCEVIGSTSEGLWLNEGFQRFDFTLILPASLGSHDWHHNGKVSHTLYAELEGLPDTSSPSMFSFRRTASRGSFGSNRGSATPPAFYRSRSPSPLSSSPRSLSPPLSPMLSASASVNAPSLSITRQEQSLPPQVPSYEVSEADSKGKAVDEGWIKGTYNSTRDLAVFHNPNPNDHVNDLDERISAFVPGIGVYDLKLFSDVFSIGGPVHARLTLPDLSPQATIFSWRLLLAQTHTISSPRDDPATSKPITHTRQFVVVEHGTRPPLDVRHPGPEYPAMWRGEEAGGTSRGFFKIEGHGSMPKDDRGRPSTLAGVKTPIRVTHELIYEIYFSIYGETDQGVAMNPPGPGGLKFMKVTRPIIVPSCALIPGVLNLPSYAPICANGKVCRTCKMRTDQQICVNCQPTILPHPRHDHPPELVGNKAGVCPECSKSVMPDGDGCEVAELCACGVGLENIEERMKKFVLEGVETNYQDEAAECMQQSKADAERGRSRRRSPSRERR